MPSDEPTIVVVEDDPSMGQAIDRILRAGGFEPIVFTSAESFLDTAAALRVDCLILDIHLPGLSGFELYRGLLLNGSKPPAIFITGHDEPAVREEAWRLGATGYQCKPFSGRALLNAVAQAVGSS